MTTGVETMPAGMYRVSESSLHVFQDSILDRCVDEILEIQVFKLIGTANYKAPKGKTTLIHLAIEGVLSPFIAGSAVNDVIHMKFDSLSE